MKRNLFLFLFLCSSMQSPLMAKSMDSPTQEQKTAPFHSFTGKILGNKVRLRLHPNLEGHIVKELSKGDIFAVVAESEDYFAIAPTNDMKAYVYRTYIMEGKVDAEHVNIRLQPNLDSPVVAQLNCGDAVDVQLSSQHSKWYELSIPEGVTFWVAKEYVENIGPVEYALKYKERLSEAQQLLETAKLITQSEFRKAFPEVDLKRLVQNFEKITRDFKDIDKICQAAQDEITKLEKNYCSKKIAYLEGKADQAELQVETLHAKLSNFNAEDNDSNPTEMMREIQTHQFTLNFPKSITDKMKVWQPIESSLFMAWASEQPESNLEHFYGHEALNSEKISGIIEPFNTFVKFTPGDFVLSSKGQTVAYLYSTHVNLQEMVGKKVTLKVSPRDNHNFAFPAFYVLEVEE